MFELYKVNAKYYFTRWLQLNSETFKKDGVITTCESDDYCDTFYLETEDKKGFVKIWFNYVVEEQINNKNDDKSNFYLHFEIAHIAQCTYLFGEFYKVLIQRNEKRKYAVLCCCSGGLTSCLYSSKLQELAELRKYNIRIDAAPIFKLSTKFQDYDMILLAPQIGHEQANLMREYGQTIKIVRISPIDYATLNLNSTFEIICDEASKKKLL